MTRRALVIAGGVLVALALAALLLWNGAAGDSGEAARVMRAHDYAATRGADAASRSESPNSAITAVPFKAPDNAALREAGAARARGENEKVTLIGRCVAAESGKPLAGCRIDLTGHQATGYDLGWAHLDWRDPEPAVTDDDGVFRFKLGLLQAEAPADGYAPRVHLDITGAHVSPGFGMIAFNEFPPGGRLDLGDIPLHHGVRRTVCVVNESGSPVPAVTVDAWLLPVAGDDASPRGRIATSRWHRERTRIDGTTDFGAPLEPGRWGIDVRDRQVVSGPATFDVGADGGAVLPVTMVIKAADVARSISGRVIDEVNRPLAGLTLAAFWHDAEDKRAFVEKESASVVSDETGAFTLLAPEAGPISGTAQIRCAQARRYDGWADLGDIAWGSQGVSLVVKRSGRVVLSVVAAEDQTPVTDVAVRCRPATAAQNAAVVRVGGHFAGGRVEIPNLAPGRHVVQVFPSRDSLATSAWLPVEVSDAGTVELRVELAATVGRKVRVALAGGPPVAGTRVDLVFGGDTMPLPGERTVPATVETDAPSPMRSKSERILADRGTTDAAGEVVLRAPAFTGKVWVCAAGPGHVPGAIGLPGWNAESDPVQLTVVAGATIRGRVEPVSVIDALDVSTPQTGLRSASLHEAGRRHAYGQIAETTDRPLRPRIVAHLVDATATGTAEDDLVLSRRRGRRRGVEPDAPIGLDGTFEIADVAPGRVRLMLTTFAPSRGYSPSKIQPKALTELTVVSGQVAEVVISVGDFITEGTPGRVTLDGAPLGDCAVELFRPPVAKGSAGGLYSDPREPADVLRTDATGAILPKNVAAGEYVAVVVVAASAGQPVTRIPCEEHVRIEAGHLTDPIEIRAKWSTVRFASDGGVRTGHWIEWHPNGQKHAEGAYEGGQRTGAWVFWTNEGAVDAVASGDYLGGVRTRK